MTKTATHTPTPSEIDNSKSDAIAAATRLAERSGYGFIVLGRDGVWRATDRKPLLRTYDMRVFEVRDGRLFHA